MVKIKFSQAPISNAWFQVAGGIMCGGGVAGCERGERGDVIEV